MEIYELTVKTSGYTEKFYLVPKGSRLQGYYQKPDGSFEKLARVGSTWQSVTDVDFVPVHESGLQLILEKILEAEKNSQTHVHTRKDR